MLITDVMILFLVTSNFDFQLSLCDDSMKV